MTSGRSAGYLPCRPSPTDRTEDDHASVFADDRRERSLMFSRAENAGRTTSAVRSSPHTTRDAVHGHEGVECDSVRSVLRSRSPSSSHPARRGAPSDLSSVLPTRRTQRRGPPPRPRQAARPQLHPPQLHRSRDPDRHRRRRRRRQDRPRPIHPYPRRRRRPAEARRRQCADRRARGRVPQRQRPPQRQGPRQRPRQRPSGHSR